MGEVKSIFGGPTGAPEPSPACVEVLEVWLEMAKSGHITGAVLAGQCCDGSAQYAVGGRIGGYSLVGALELAKADLVGAMRDD